MSEFSATLYEKRWHEILKFLKSLLPRLKVLAYTFDVEKFRSGVDFSGASRPEQARVQESQEAQAGLSKFSPEAVKLVLRDPVFHHFVHLVFLLEKMPDKLAKFGEGCPCHGVLLPHMSRYAADRLMESHYGEGITACPASGMMAPEIVGGVLEKLFEGSMRDLETEMLEVQCLPRAPEMDAGHWEKLMRNCRSAHKHLMSLLKLKTVFWQQLPWILCGLALLDEVRAKEIGRKAIQMFSKDPRREVHHRLTWFWLRPGGLLRYQLDLYVSTDMSRDEVGQPCCRVVAALRFVIVVETTIEAKHAVVTAARRRHAIGPVRVSLSNRLQMLEKWIVHGHMTAEELVACFDRMRSLKSLMREFGFDLTPEVMQRRSVGSEQPRRLHHNFLRPVCIKVFYVCGVESMYRSLRAQADHDRKAKDQQRRKEASAAAPERLCRDSVKRRAMVEHCAEVIDSNSFYGCPASAWSLTSLGGVLNEPASKRARLNSGALCLRGEVDLLDAEGVGVDPLQSDPQGMIYIQPVFANAGRKKVVRTSPGAGGRLNQNDMLVSVHKSLVGFGSETVLWNRSAAAGRDLPIFVMREDFKIDDVMEFFVKYKGSCQ